MAQAQRRRLWLKHKGPKHLLSRKITLMLKDSKAKKEFLEEEQESDLSA